MLRGYNQIPVHPQSREITAFITQEGLFQFRAMPFGLKNAPATYQRMISDLVAGLPGVKTYLDDVIIFSQSWTEHLEHLTNFFYKADQANLTINLSKSDFGHTQVPYLGFKVGNSQVFPLEAKIKAINDVPTPTNRREVRRFLGMSGYYRRFCPNFSDVAEPLTDLLRKGHNFE